MIFIWNFVINEIAETKAEKSNTKDFVWVYATVAISCFPIHGSNVTLLVLGISKIIV